MNLQEMTVTQLTALYNERVSEDKQIKKFSTKDEGIRRVGKLLEQEKPVVAEPVKAEKPAKVRRIDLILEAIKAGPCKLEDLASKFNTTKGVVSNDIFDLRKQGHKVLRNADGYRVESA